MDKKNINSKSTSVQMREMIKRVRTGNFVDEAQEKTSKKNMSMRDMLKITRKLNEAVDDKMQNKETVFDEPRDEANFRNYFKNLMVNIKFIDMEVYDDLIFWGGTINGIIQFVYKVTPDESTTGVEFNYLEPYNPDFDEIIKRVKSYFDNVFYPYWQKNILSQK